MTQIHADWASREDIEAVMFDDEIFDRTNDDFAPRKEDCNIFNADLSGFYFIGGYVDGKIASLFIVHDERMHYWVLKDHRVHARKLLDVSFDIWPHRVYVAIPDLYRSVINFAKNYGFVETKIEDASYLKNGQYYNTYYLEYDPWAEL